MHQCVTLTYLNFDMTRSLKVFLDEDAVQIAAAASQYVGGDGAVA